MKQCYYCGKQTTLQLHRGRLLCSQCRAETKKAVKEIMEALKNGNKSEDKNNL